jgi:hypothetical protein
MIRNLAAIVIGLFIGPLSEAQTPPRRTIHVFVALADNQNQGIVPVPARLGNGLDPVHNLYWGAAVGVKTFFARSADWVLLNCGEKPKPEILERCVYKHRNTEDYLVADAYRGNEIRQTILDFFDAAAGASPETITLSVPSYALTLTARGGRVWWLTLGTMASWIFACRLFRERKTNFIAMRSFWRARVSSILPSR